MKGYIAICQHFHQPHFQLHKTREKVFNLSYSNWIEILESLSEKDGFYINIHFSGPFLYWLRSEKIDYLTRLARIVRNGKIGIIGGFADEAFIQLSTRADDVTFQIKEYEKLTKELFRVQASDWQGFHIPERECGELLLHKTTKAISSFKATPLYYLDAETFYQSYYAEPGSEADYCKHIFGFNDPVSKTTISHYPKELLRFAFRDIIEGQSFVSIPIHCEERYWFLKCEHDVGISPIDYLHKIKDVINKAAELSNVINPNKVPVVVIFEDAEKLGDWSGQPYRDSLWFKQLIELICNDDEIELTGLRNYYEEQGVFDTYPIQSSHSYIEWENWTAKRGIRGVVYSDEKIRKMVALLHHFESDIDGFERALLRSFEILKNEKFIDMIMNSSERYLFISELLQDHVNRTASDYYLLIQRIRNLLYQEDSKWAIRHPNYGSAPYLDNLGSCFLEIAERLFLKLQHMVYPDTSNEVFAFIDWMEDAQKRIFIHTEYQTLSINPKGAGVDYYVILNKKYATEKMFSKVLPDVKDMKSYSSIYRYVCPVVFTETDSSLCCAFNQNGERIEKCRRSFTINISRRDGNKYEQIAVLRENVFSLIENEQIKHGYKLVFQCVVPVNTEKLTFIAKLKRIYLVRKDGITVKTSIETDNDLCGDIFLSTEIVTSITASDEVDLLPEEGIKIISGEKQCNIVILDSDDEYKCYDYPSNGVFLFTYRIRTGTSDSFWNGIKYTFLPYSEVSHIIISPTVKNFYKNYVGGDQSELNYHSSGIKIEPFTQIKNGQASITTKQDFLWNMKSPKKGNYISFV